jgi:hypothetical protein
MTAKVVKLAEPAEPTIARVLDEFLAEQEATGMRHQVFGERQSALDVELVDPSRVASSDSARILTNSLNS